MAHKINFNNEPPRIKHSHPKLRIGKKYRYIGIDLHKPAHKGKISDQAGLPSSLISQTISGAPNIAKPASQVYEHTDPRTSPFVQEACPFGGAGNAIQPASAATPAIK